MFTLQLNSIKPAFGSNRPKCRLGRGLGSGFGKTCGRGHKGQKSRSGGYRKIGFEGGQMPLQRRLPKRGFVSRKKLGHVCQEIRLSDLQSLGIKELDMDIMRSHGLVKKKSVAKIINSGKLSSQLVLKGIPATAGARNMIEAFNGSLISK